MEKKKLSLGPSETYVKVWKEIDKTEHGAAMFMNKHQNVYMPEAKHIDNLPKEQYQKNVETLKKVVKADYKLYQGLGVTPENIPLAMDIVERWKKATGTTKP